MNGVSRFYLAWSCSMDPPRITICISDSHLPSGTSPMTHSFLEQKVVVTQNALSQLPRSLVSDFPFSYSLVSSHNVNVCTCMFVLARWVSLHCTPRHSVIPHSLSLKKGAPPFRPSINSTKIELWQTSMRRHAASRQSKQRTFLEVLQNWFGKNR